MVNNECTLTDEQLAQKAHDWISKLSATGGQAWSLRVPVDFDHDPDMIFCEVVKRMLRVKRLDFSFDKEGLISFGSNGVTFEENKEE